MPTAYLVVLLHREQDDLAREISEAILSAAEAALSHAPLLKFASTVTAIDPDAHAAVVYIGSTAGRKDEAVERQLQKALELQIPILPVLRTSDSGTAGEKLPSTIENLNATYWDSQRDLSLVSLLGMLGLVESERKVFLSYRQSESTPLADQLHVELVRRRFDVFLDRFTLPPGEDFQRRLDEDLGDKAFVVLLESGNLRHSRWVEHEISYAHSHRIEVLAITLPDVDNKDLIPVLDEAFRIRLAKSDLSNGELTQSKLRAVLEAIELAHSRALRRRREQMLGSLTDHLRAEGWRSLEVRDWTILATRTHRTPRVFLVTPRTPQPDDLYALHLARCEVVCRMGTDDVCGMIVHEVDHVADKRRRVLSWIGKSGNLQIATLRGYAEAQPTP